jgi:hypothetical protein
MLIIVLCQPFVGRISSNFVFKRFSFLTFSACLLNQISASSAYDGKLNVHEILTYVQNLPKIITNSIAKLTP